MCVVYLVADADITPVLHEQFQRLTVAVPGCLMERRITVLAAKKQTIMITHQDMANRQASKVEKSARPTQKAGTHRHGVCVGILEHGA